MHQFPGILEESGHLENVIREIVSIETLLFTYALNLHVCHAPHGIDNKFPMSEISTLLFSLLIYFHSQRNILRCWMFYFLYFLANFIPLLNSEDKRML